MVSLPVPLNVLQEERNIFVQINSRPATLPVSHPTKSFWIDSSPDANPNAKEGSSGTLTNDADICIIGSGITGVSAAYFLAKTITSRSDVDLQSKDHRPFRIVILEARDFCQHEFCLVVARHSTFLT